VQIFFKSWDVELLEFVVIIKIRTEWIGLGIVLMQDVEVKGVWPPMEICLTDSCHSAVCDWACA
jgi:hypothetical protein